MFVRQNDDNEQNFAVPPPCRRSSAAIAVCLSRGDAAAAAAVGPLKAAARGRIKFCCRLLSFVESAARQNFSHLDCHHHFASPTLK